MAYKKFKSTDIFHNTLEMNPGYDFVVYDGSVYLNNAPGTVDLYEGVSGSYPFLEKTSDRISFKEMSSIEYSVQEYAPHVMTGAAPQTASIVREYITSSASERGATANHLNSLQNTINHYRTVSDYFDYGYYSDDAVNLISIPSIVFGSEIKKGTVELNYYVSGTLIGQLKDSKRNGELIQTTGVGTDSVAGIVLYNEGFVILTGSWDIGNGFAGEDYNGAGIETPSWINFGAGMNDGLAAGTAPSSSFGLTFEGTSKAQTITLLAHAEKGEFNHSNNPTYKEYGQTLTPQSSSVRYVEPSELAIKNIASSSFSDTEEDFQKTTYISSVAVYDENKNLIGIAKMATPIRKDENTEYSIRLQIDI